MIRPRILMNDGVFGRLTHLASGNGRPLLVTDRRLESHVDKFRSMFPNAVVFDKVQHEPTIRTVRDIQSVMQSESQSLTSIVALGGGSPIDAAKAANCIRHGRKGALRIGKPRLPLTAIPTTAGTGSEVTPFAVIKTKHEKRLLSDARLVPHFAVLDVELTMSKSASLTAYTGIDALCHALEAYVSRRSNAESDDHAVRAMQLIGSSLLQCVKDPSLSSRRRMMRGSMLAGYAFSSSSVTLVHGMSRPLGRFGIPHGLANAQLAPAVFAFTESRARRMGDRATLARLAEARAALWPESRRSLSAMLAELADELEIPPPDVDRGHFLSAVDDMVHEAFASGSPANHPVQASKRDVRDLYRAIAPLTFS